MAVAKKDKFAFIKKWDDERYAVVVDGYVRWCGRDLGVAQRIANLINIGNAPRNPDQPFPSGVLNYAFETREQPSNNQCEHRRVDTPRIAQALPPPGRRYRFERSPSKLWPPAEG